MLFSGENNGARIIRSWVRLCSKVFLLPHLCPSSLPRDSPANWQSLNVLPSTIFCTAHWLSPLLYLGHKSATDVLHQKHENLFLYLRPTPSGGDLWRDSCPWDRTFPTSPSLEGPSPSPACVNSTYRINLLGRKVLFEDRSCLYEFPFFCPCCSHKRAPYPFLINLSCAHFPPPPTRDFPPQAAPVL